MQTFKNKKFIKRNRECTNLVACVADSAPNENWEACDASIIDNLDKLHTQAGVSYYGYQ